VTVKIAHISDTHATQGKEFMEGSFNIMVETVNASPADLVVHTGDITGSGLKEEFPLAKRLLGKIEKPIVVLVGNHDARNVGTDLFEEYIGPTRGVYTNDDLDLFMVYVDSTVPDQNDGRIGALQYDWLNRQLIDHQGYGKKLVALHHHLVPVPHAGRERNVLNNAGDMLDLLIKYDIDLVLCGHRHFPNVYRVEDMVISNAGCASCRKTRMGDLNSYNWVELGHDTISIEVRRLDGDVVKYPTIHPSPLIHQAEPRPMLRIGHIAGTYFGVDSYVRAKYENAARKLNSLGPDVVIHCGNIVGVGREADFALAEKELGRIDAPMLFASGPRDINYLGHMLFKRHFGSQWQHMETDEYLLQGINSVQYDSEIGVVGILGRDELAKVFDEHSAKFRVAFLHHNVVPIPRIRERGLLEDAGDLLESFIRQGVDLVLTGCSSYPSALKVDGTLLVNANTISDRIHRSPFGCSFNIIDVYRDFIIVQEIHSLWGSRRTLGIWQREPAGPPEDLPDERKRTRRELLVGRLR
jgi:3',5'-cyclic AMP phosphodiesterase CpdA